ncbi:hypothetical protein ABKA04_000785 [Annulohypoxylon sp. FPYF3050]
MAHQFWHHDMMPFKGRRITVDVGGGNWERFLGYAIELGQGMVTDGYVHQDDHYLVVNHEQWGKKTVSVQEAIRHFIPIVTPKFIKDACVMRELPDPDKYHPKHNTRAIKRADDAIPAWLAWYSDEKTFFLTFPEEQNSPPAPAKETKTRIKVKREPESDDEDDGGKMASWNPFQPRKHRKLLPKPAIQPQESQGIKDESDDADDENDGQSKRFQPKKSRKSLPQPPTEPQESQGSEHQPGDAANGGNRGKRATREKYDRYQPRKYRKLLPKPPAEPQEPQGSQYETPTPVRDVATDFESPTRGKSQGGNNMLPAQNQLGRGSFGQTPASMAQPRGAVLGNETSGTAGLAADPPIPLRPVLSTHSDNEDEGTLPPPFLPKTPDRPISQPNFSSSSTGSTVYSLDGFMTVDRKGRLDTEPNLLKTPKDGKVWDPNGSGRGRRSDFDDWN